MLVGLVVCEFAQRDAQYSADMRILTGTASLGDIAQVCAADLFFFRLTRWLVTCKNETGEEPKMSVSFRTERPVYVDRLPPCNNTCPAGENIQAWLNRAETGDYQGAWQLLVRDNPLPAIMGRVCYHPCESACNRVKKDEPVSIHAVERFLGDEAIRNGWSFTAGAPTGKHVLIVGSGPSGLSAAYHLSLFGHKVTIYEAGPIAGGMMRFGIPKYRLPREVLDAEIARITAMGVTIQLNTRVDDLMRVLDSKQFDAVFLAVGAHVSKRAYIPAGDAAKILDALGVLRNVDGGQPPELGRRVLIYGGGRGEHPAGSDEALRGGTAP
jgi:NADPH-dependent glutamate synthase beta subunit-like oxidoreductase